MKKSYLTFIYVILYFPLLVLMIYSFNDARYSLVWHGPTLHWYQELFQDHDLWMDTGRSLFLGVMTATLATGIGVLTATLIYRYEFFGHFLLNALLFILILSPEIFKKKKNPFNK